MNTALSFTQMLLKASGRYAIDVNEMNIDLMTVNAHKLYGPKGVGALYVREGTKLDLFSMVVDTSSA